MIRVKHGNWGLSQIVSFMGGWTCAAQVNNPTARIDIHYPPLDRTTGTYTQPWALIWTPDTLANTTGTYMVPRRIDVDTLTIADLTNPQRNAARTATESRFTGYSYTNWDGSIVTVPAFDFDIYPLSTPLVDLIRGIYAYFGHSDYRPRPATLEAHNTEYTDDFSTDPAARWTGILGGTFAHDAVNNEMDCDTSNIDAIVYYSANDPGSIEQEAQHTYFLDGRATKDYYGTAVRVDGTATDGYVAMASNQDDLIYVFRYLAGTRSTIGSSAKTLAVDEWHTTRLAVSGGVGSNAVCDIWDNLDGASKPSSDPGWYGVDGTPDWTVTDSSVDRLDASTHIKCGVGWIGGGADWDNAADWFKERAITDRAGTDPEGSLIHGKLLSGGLLIHGVLT